MFLHIILTKHASGSYNLYMQFIYQQMRFSNYTLFGYNKTKCQMNLVYRVRHVDLNPAHVMVDVWTSILARCELKFSAEYSLTKMIHN